MSISFSNPGRAGDRCREGLGARHGRGDGAIGVGSSASSGGLVGHGDGREGRARCSGLEVTMPCGNLHVKQGLLSALLPMVRVCLWSTVRRCTSDERLLSVQLTKFDDPDSA